MYKSAVTFIRKCTVKRLSLEIRRYEAGQWSERSEANNRDEHSTVNSVCICEPCD